MAEKIVKLLEPWLCRACRFHQRALVEQEGVRLEMLYCTRLDCDNWEAAPEAAPVHIIHPLSEIE